MSADTPAAAPPLRIVVACLAAFLAVLGAFVALTLTDNDPGALVTMLVTLGGLVGVGAHTENRLRRQNVTLSKIDRQTNGVLTERIETGAAAAVRAVLAERDAAAAAQATAGAVPVTLPQD